MSKPRILILLLRRDLRLHDNPIFNALCNKNTYCHTHVLPIYIFNPSSLEVRGFLSEGQESPYPECRSRVGKFWRCGPHRCRFIAESVWDLKESLKKLNSDLVLRVGKPEDVAENIIKSLKQANNDIVGVWMTSLVGTEEAKEERNVEKIATKEGVKFKKFNDGSYLYEEKDLKNPVSKLPDVFTVFRKTLEPLRDTIPPPLPAPDSLAPLPGTPVPQAAPFEIPKTLEGLMKALLSPLSNLGLPGPPLQHPAGAKSAHPFRGGETEAKKRLHHLLITGAMPRYGETRNGLLGSDFSSRFSAYFSQGSLSARFVHQVMLMFENGEDWTRPLGMAVDNKSPPGFGCGEQDGMTKMRFELLWRDYFRFCALKFKEKVFSVHGYRGDTTYKWKYLPEAQEEFARFQRGNTGCGLVDASMRELYLTGWTSNRTRQNVANYLAKRLKIDWRLGAEWYESMLVDYEMASNWGNWQYNAGVGNDPRGEERVFNQIKQGRDYDNGGAYVRTWCEELRKVSGEVWQTATLSEEDKKLVKCASEDGRIMVETPLCVIEDRGGKKSHGPREPKPKKERAQKEGGRGGRGGGGEGRGGNGHGGHGHGGHGHGGHGRGGHGRGNGEEHGGGRGGKGKEKEGGDNGAEKEAVYG